MWQFAPAGEAIRTRGAVRTRGGQPLPPVTAVLAPGQPQARIVLSRDGRVVELRLDALRADQPPPLVLLIPGKDGSQSRVQEPERQGDAGPWVVRFDGSEPGDYLVVFEPSA